MAANLEVVISATDRFSGTANRVIGKLNQMSRLGKTWGKVGGDIGHGARVAAGNIERLGYIAAGLAIGGGAAAVKWAGDFQAGMQTINTVALKSPAVLAQAGEGLRALFRETGQSMTDLQAAEYDLVSAGVHLEDAQTGVSTAVHLGIGALGSTSEAVDVLTTAINAYNLKAKDGSIATGTWARISDELAQAVADGKVKLSDIAAEYAVVAPMAANFGVSTGEIAASLGFLTAKGNSAGEVMTQMRRAIQDVVNPGKDMKTVLASFGMSGEKLIRKHGLAGALELIRKRAEKLHIPFIDLFKRQEGFAYALQTTGPNAKGFADELDHIRKSAGMTNKQFDERAQGFNYQLGVLKANVQDAGITIGTALLPKLTELAQKAAEFLRTHQADIKKFADDLAAGFEKAVTWASKLDWAAIADGVRSVIGLAKGIAEGFMAMPDEAKRLILGLYGLNKLSGGAVVDVGVDVAKGILGQFFARGASPLNPMWVASVGGLGGGGGPDMPGQTDMPGQKPSGGGGGWRWLRDLAALAVVPTAVFGFAELMDEFSQNPRSKELSQSLQGVNPTQNGQAVYMSGGKGSVPIPINPALDRLGKLQSAAELLRQQTSPEAWRADERESNRITRQTGTADQVAAQDRARAELTRVRASNEANRIALVTGQRAITTAVNLRGAATVGAINKIEKAPKINNKVIVNVSVNGARRTAYAASNIGAIDKMTRPGAPDT